MNKIITPQEAAKDLAKIWNKHMTPALKKVKGPVYFTAGGLVYKIK